MTPQGVGSGFQRRVIANSRRIESIVRGDSIENGNGGREESNNDVEYSNNYKRGYPMEYGPIYYAAATILLDCSKRKGFTAPKAMRLVGFSQEDCKSRSIRKRVGRVRDRMEKRRVAARTARQKRLLKLYEKRMRPVLASLSNEEGQGDAGGDDSDTNHETKKKNNGGENTAAPVPELAREKVRVYCERMQRLGQAGNAEAEGILKEWEERLADSERRRSPRLLSQPRATTK